MRGMTLEDRITEVEQKFNEKQAEREECLQEMLRLQGEHRVLLSLLNEKKGSEPGETSASVPVSDKANVIEATAAEENK